MYSTLLFVGNNMAEILTEEKVKQIIDKYVQEKIKIEIDKLKSAQ